MRFVSAFLGDNKGERMAFVSNGINFHRDIDKKIFLLANDDSLDLLPGADILAPGYAEDTPIDAALEAMVAIKDVDKAAKDLAKMLVPEEEIKEAREPFWERSARICVESIVKVSTKAEAFARKNFAPPHVSLSSRINRITVDITMKKYGKAEDHLWWEKFFEGDSTIDMFIYNNAKNTAMGLLSVTMSHLEPLFRISGVERVPLLKEDSSPVTIYTPAYSRDELLLLLSILSLRFGSESVLAIPEADTLWDIPEHINWETVILSSSRPVVEADAVTFGKGQMALPYFRKKALDTTGFERLVKLPYETPDTLPAGKNIALFRGIWEITDAPAVSAVRPRKLSFGKNETDETISDLLSAVPKCAKTKEFDPEEFVEEVDFEEFGIEILGDVNTDEE